MSFITEPAEAPLILVVDDGEDILRLLQLRLEGEGYRVRLARNGHEGVVAALEEPPALILLDLIMPVMDGFETIRELKEHQLLMHTPIIVLSSSEDTSDKVMGLELGAVDYICKPFDPPELHARVRSALRVHKLLRMLAQRAQIDGLTGLWNRAYFDDRLRRELAGAIRTDSPLSLAMCDFDHFKEINDTYGHPAGDAVLEGFARILTSELRSSDVACRFGGEEFAMIFRETPVEDAQRILERIRQRLENERWTAHPERRVTASFGLAWYHNGLSGAEDLINAADSAMYAAKQAGRNCIVRSPAEPESPRLAS
jgi:diguanylate cyclase (GGDEF)-like protein